MSKISFLLLGLLTFSTANIFTITDKKGNVLHATKMEHCENDCLNQKETEYSYQAIYDEIHREENLARRAAAAKKRVQTIAKATVKAKKAGVSYHLTDDDKKKLLDYASSLKVGNMFGVVQHPKVLTVQVMYNTSIKSTM